MQPTILDFLISFSAVLWEAMPFIVLGAVIAGILEEFLPQEFVTKLLPKAVVPAVMIGAVLGLLFPMCECGIVVVMRRLLRKGLPLSCCIAYMLAGPIINLVVIFSTWVAFRDHKIGPEMVGLRVGFAFVIATITGFVVHLQYRKYGTALLTPTAAPPPSPAADPAPPAQQAAEATPTAAPGRPSFFERLGNVSSTALHDFVDITVFLILGAVLAALARNYITEEEIKALSENQPYLAIPAMMFLAVVMCLCSEADAFVAASFTKMHISAKLAFLVLGPMLDIKLLLMYTRVFRVRLIVTIASSVVILVLVLCMLLHLVYQANHWTGLPG
ncbi:MAG: permease [Planctomycetes bacterium]|nr:permease [Planctomycetota bacterium]